MALVLFLYNLVRQSDYRAHRSFGLAYDAYRMPGGTVVIPTKFSGSSTKDASHKAVAINVHEQSSWKKMETHDACKLRPNALKAMRARVRVWCRVPPV